MPELVVPISVTRKILKAGKLDFSEDPIIVRFDQATEGEIFDREAFNQAVTETVFSPEGGRVVRTKSPAWPEIRAYDIYLTMRECNLTRKGKPLFTFDKKSGRPGGSYADFLAVWKTIHPPDIAEVLYVECLRCNPQWNYGVPIPVDDDEGDQPGNPIGLLSAETDESEK